MTIPLTYFRSSSFGSDDMCPMKYFLEYGLGWAGPGNLKADKGTIVHKVMEVLAVSKQAKQDNVKNCTDITKIFDKELQYWISSDPQSINIDELTNIVYNYYSNAFSHHNWVEADRREVKRWVNKILNYNNGYFDPRNLNIVSPEKHFDIEIKEKWAEYDYEGNKGRLRLKGTIDLITQIDEDTLEIIDWKTGQTKNWATGEEYTWETLLKNIQLRIYHLAACHMYPDAKHIFVTIFYSNHKGPFTLPFERADIPDTLELIRSKYERIRDTEMPLRIWNTDRKASYKCTKFCHFGCSTFENTSITPIKEKRRGQIAKPGQPMTKCDQVHYCLTHRNMDSVIKHMTKPGYDIGKYKAPGEVE